MPNPNELERLEQERQDLLEKILDVNCVKADKEYWLRELRKVERQLGIDGQPYNSTAFGKDYGGNGR